MKKQAGVLVALSLIWTGVGAQERDHYDFFDVGFQSIDIEFDDYELSADGYEMAFCKDYGEKLLLLAGFKRYLFDEHDMYRMRQDVYTLGVGLHSPLTEASDLYGQLFYSVASSELEAGSERDDGLEAVIGYRSWPTESFEVDASLKYVTLKDPISLTGPELSATGQARWYLSDLVSFGVGANYGEYETSWFGNVRITFGKD